MNNQNLVRLTTEKAREIGAMGGRVKSISKKTAQQIRGWKIKAKREGSDGKIFEKWVNMLEDPDFMDTQLLKALEQLNAEMIKNKASYKDRLAMLRMYQSFRETRHGKEIRYSGDPITSININETKIMNVFNDKMKPVLETMTTEQKEKLLLNLKTDVQS